MIGLDGHNKKSLLFLNNAMQLKTDRIFVRHHLVLSSVFPAEKIVETNI